MTTNLLPWRRLSDLLDDSLLSREATNFNAPLDIIESDDRYTIAVDLPAFPPKPLKSNSKKDGCGSTASVRL